MEDIESLYNSMPAIYQAIIIALVVALIIYVGKSLMNFMQLVAEGKEFDKKFFNLVDVMPIGTEAAIAITLHTLIDCLLRVLPTIFLLALSIDMYYITDAIGFKAISIAGLLISVVSFSGIMLTMRHLKNMLSKYMWTVLKN